MWDVGGQDKIRVLWKHYFRNTDALIYVVDSHDQERIDLAASELHEMLADPELANACVLVYANKQDLPGALNPSLVASRLKLNQLKSNHPWHVEGCSAQDGSGLYEGLSSLTTMLRARKSK